MNEYFSLIKNLCTKTRVILLQTPVFRVHTNVETLVPSRPFSAKIGMIKDSSLNLWLNFYEYLLLKKKEISNIWVISETFISYIQYLNFGNINIIITFRYECNPFININTNSECNDQQIQPERCLRSTCQCIHKTMSWIKEVYWAKCKIE